MCIRDSLVPNDVRDRRYAFHQVRIDVLASPRLDVVHDDRDRYRFRNRLEVEEDTFVARAVVVGRDDENGVRAKAFGPLCEGDAVPGGVRSCPGYHLRLAPELGDGKLRELYLLVIGQGGRFARRCLLYTSPSPRD